MPTNNNTQPALLQCAICPTRLSCPWSQFSNAIKQKYCPVLMQELEIEDTKGAHEDERESLRQFIQERLN